AELPGILRGERLAEAYANMDAFVFPSETDTFGNVVVEAMACGVPAIVSPLGGPRFLIDHGETGFVAASDADLLKSVLILKDNRQFAHSMGANARRKACERSWNRVFSSVYERYAEAFASGVLSINTGTSMGGPYIARTMVVS